MSDQRIPDEVLRYFERGGDWALLPDARALARELLEARDVIRAALHQYEDACPDYWPGYYDDLRDLLPKEGA